MQPEQILRKLTEKGILVTPGMMEGIRSGELSYESITGSPPGKPSPGRKHMLSVKTKNTARMERMSPQDFIKYYNNRFDGVKAILLKKMDAVSINKLADGFSDVSVIGMVRERIPHGFVVEDATGDIEVVSKEPVQDDDILGAVGTVKEGKLFASQIIWPDVPLKNGASFIPGLTFLLTTSPDENIRRIASGFGLVFFPGGDAALFPGNEKRIICDIMSPSHITITKEGKEFRILFYKPPGKASKDEAVSYLKKRHLLPDKKEISSTSDPFLLDPVPDLIWIVGGERSIERYKGATIIISGTDDSIRYDAGTGQASFAYEQPAMGKT